MAAPEVEPAPSPPPGPPLGPRVALIHATPVAVDPVLSAFAADWPSAELVNLLDDSLGADRARDPELTPALRRRIAELGDYALTGGAQAILYTCSAFGPAIEAVAARAPVPVLKPNEAMFAAALETGQRIAMLATFPPSIASMEAEFRQQAASLGSAAVLESHLVADALDALKGGDAERHNALVAQAAARLPAVDAILLAQFSTSRALEAVGAVTEAPVLTSPAAAVALLRRLLDRPSAL